MATTIIAATATQGNITAKRKQRTVDDGDAASTEKRRGSHAADRWPSKGRESNKGHSKSNTDGENKQSRR